MKHFIIFFYFISFSAGFSFLFLGTFLWYKNKLEKLKYLILFGFSLTLILLEQMITAYEIVNLVDDKSLGIVLRNISAVGCGIMIYSLTKLIIIFFPIRWTQKIKIILFSVSIFPFIMINLYHITGIQFLLPLTNVVFFGIVLINIVLLACSLDKMENPLIKASVRTLIIISLLMFPLLFLDTMIERLPYIGTYFPFGLFTVFLYYIILSSFGLYYLIRYFNTLLYPKSASDSREKRQAKNIAGMMEELLVMNNVTKREKEIILLLVKGYSYQYIGEKLVISLPTVKSHVYNIYKKLGVKNKVELINLISDQERQE